MEVRRFAHRGRSFEPGETVVVGVSGGPDSLCLLHVLHRLAPELGVRLHVGHLNHSLRGAEADADAEFVIQFASGLGLPCTVGRADVAAMASVLGLSLEEAARHARYRFLAKVTASAGAHVIAVGHNADDQAETVLMHFLRGSGVAGLRGMSPKAQLADYRLIEGAQATAAGGHDTWSGLWLVRPLLAVSRTDIEAYCVEQGLHPRFDRSNEDTTFFRNRLRHELMPILERYNPQVRRVLTHTAEGMAGDYDLLRADLDEAWARVIPQPQDSPVLDMPVSSSRASSRGGEISLDLAVWRDLPIGLQRATIREAIRRLRASLRDINWEHVERAVWLAREGETGQAATLAAGLELQIGYRSLRIAEEGMARPYDLPQIVGPVLLASPGVAQLPDGWQVVVQHLQRSDLRGELPAGFGSKLGAWVAYLDAEAVGSDLVLRPRVPGERFQPQGLAGHRVKLNEFMINAKTPKDARVGWPLLIGRGGIAWVCGLRVDQRAIVRPDTSTVWRVAFMRN